MNGSGFFVDKGKRFLQIESAGDRRLCSVWLHTATLCRPHLMLSSEMAFLFVFQASGVIRSVAM